MMNEQVITKKLLTEMKFNAKCVITHSCKWGQERSITLAVSEIAPYTHK